MTGSTRPVLPIVYTEFLSLHSLLEQMQIYRKYLLPPKFNHNQVFTLISIRSDFLGYPRFSIELLEVNPALYLDQSTTLFHIHSDVSWYHT